MAIPFLKGIDVTGTVDLSNLTIDGAQGTDGQVLTSTGQGIAWEDAPGGASLSGGAANKLAIWTSATALTNDTNLHWDTSNDRLGIGTPSPQAQLHLYGGNLDTRELTISNASNVIYLNTKNGPSTGDGTDIGPGLVWAPYYSGYTKRSAGIMQTADGNYFRSGLAFFTNNVSNAATDWSERMRIDMDGNVGIGETTPDRPLVVSETRTDSTASDAYTTVVKSVQGSGLTTNPGTGGLKVQYTSSSSNVHAFGLVAGSSSSDFLTTGPMHFYTNSDLDTVSATGFAMQLDTSQRLILGSMTASQKLNVAGNVTADRYYGNSSTVYYVDPNDGTQSANLASKIRVGTGSLILSLTPNWGVDAQNIFASTNTTNGGTVTLMNVSSTDAAGDASGTLQFVIGAGNTGSMGGTGYATAAITAISRSNPGSGTSGGGNLIFKTSGGYSNVSEKMRLTESGKLGIGIDPTEKLHVDDGFLKVQPPDISSTTPPSITIRSLTNQYQSGMESSGHLTMKSPGSSSNFYWYQGSTNVMRYTNGLYVNKILDINSDAYYLDPASSGVSLHINGIIDQDFSVTDLNSAWTAPGTSRDQGFIFGRFQSNASNKPATNDNANWFANIYSHASGGTASYGIQLAGSNAGSGENALQLRNVSNGSFASWRKVYHEGHKPTYSELGTMAYSNLTGTPTIPTNYLTNNAFDQGVGLYLTGGSYNAGTDTATSPLVIDEEDFILTKDGGYLRRLIGKTSDSIHIGQSGTGLISSINFLPGTAGNTAVKVNGNPIFHEGHKPTWSEIESKPSTFAPSSHNHAASNITSGTFDAARIAHNSFDIGDTTAETGRSVHETGIYTFNRNNGTLGTGTESAYYSVLAFGQGTGGSVQIAGQWTSGGHKLYWRSLRDTTDNWWDWKEIYHTTHKPTPSEVGAVAKTGDTMTGALTIDTTTHATLSLDRASTSYDNNLIFRTAGSTKWRLWQDGSDDYLYIRDEVNSNNLMTWRKGVGVGINTGTPNATLHLQVPTAAAPSIFLQAATNFAPGIYFDDSNTGTSAAGAITYATANNTFSIKANSTSVVTISSGTTTIAATADIVAYSSDKRLKENVQPIEKPLNKILKLEGVTYNWNKKAEDVAGFDTEIKEVGLFAQDVQKVLPEAVKLAPFDTGEDFKSKSGEDYLTVQYEKIVPLLVEAIKDQQKQIDELKSIINGSS